MSANAATGSSTATGGWAGFVRLFFAAYALGAVGAAATDLFDPTALSSRTAWGPGSGWQREIAALDLLVAIQCAFHARWPQPAASTRALALGLVVLSGGIALNNGHAFASGGPVDHLQFAALHGLACLLALAIAVRAGR